MQCGKPSVGYGSLCDAKMNTRQPPYRTDAPIPRVGLEAVNKAVGYQGTVAETHDDFGVGR